MKSLLRSKVFKIDKLRCYDIEDFPHDFHYLATYETDIAIWLSYKMEIFRPEMQILRTRRPSNSTSTLLDKNKDILRYLYE